MLKIKGLFEKYKNVLIISFFIIILSIIRYLLAYNFPIIPLIGAGEDDALMVNWAYALKDNAWLGPYGYNTLMKGPAFPIILAILYKLNIRYLSFTTIFYIISCILLIISIKDLFKNKYWLLIIFPIILFNPIMYSSEVFQRVYRNSLIPSFAILIPACYFGIYLNRDKNIIKTILWTIIGSISLCLFYYTREDSMWIMPFIIFMSFIILVSLGIKTAKGNESKVSNVLKIVLIIMPIVCLYCFGEKIALTNESYYGVKTKNVLSDSYFTDALHAMYEVRSVDLIDGVTITQEKAGRMAAESPTLNRIYPYLIETIGGYGTLDRNPTDGECEDGWIIWAIRQAVNKSGIIGNNNLKLEQIIYKDIAEELNHAMDIGHLERQFTFPSPLLSPPRKSYIPKTIEAFFKSVIYIATFKDIDIRNDDIVEKNIDSYDSVHKFEIITHERALYYEGTTDGDKEANQLKDQEEYIKSLESKKNILTVTIKIYSILGIILLILGMISYIILTVKFIKGLIKKDYFYNDKWYISSGLLGALLTLLSGIAYNEVATAYSIRVLYLCGTYPLFLSVCIITFCLCFQKKRELLENKSYENKED